MTSRTGTAPTASEGAARTFTIRPQGAFSLRESVEFGFGQRHAEAYDGVMRLAFVLDGTPGQPYGEQVGVVLRQASEVGDNGAIGSGDADGEVLAEVWGEGDLDAVRDQVARVLSLDIDGRGFADVGRRDPVIGRLQQLADGLRPPLFHSPYEAAAWSVLSARRPAQQMALVRDRLSAEHGRTFELAGRSVAAFPTPAQLLAVEGIEGLTEEKVTRLHGVASAALDGRLDAGQLRSLGPEAAAERLQELNGIGPFYATLISVRAVGFADALPGNEPRLLALVGDLYGFGRPATAAELEQVGESWRPYRTWAAVLVRAAAGRVDPAG